MLVTEEQAKRRICPYRTTAPLVRKEVPINTSKHCVAAHCMAWRWNPADRREGYCGLAGEPTQ